jgi:DNA-binding NarL/FixJ family response regulator
MPLRCLLVDDSDDFLASARSLLVAQGVDVVASATTGDEALQLARSLLPDVALVDVELGKEDGISVARKLTAYTPSVRTILISAHELDDIDELVTDGPIVGYLSKGDLGAAAIEALLASGPPAT